VAAALACVVFAGCDRPFKPYLENTDVPFSIFGYLDLGADTQWVRVMPVRQNLFLGPEPIDATVTLQKVGGEPVTMHDSLFSFTDPKLEATAYAHDFWTAERLEPGATYELRAVRSDGAATTARIVMPPALEFSLLHARDAGELRVKAAKVLAVDLIYTMGERYSTPWGDSIRPAPSVSERAPAAIPTSDPATQEVGFAVNGASAPGAIYDMDRAEVRVTAAGADWPYDARLSDLEATLPGLMPSNVEGGFGFVGGVATWTVPFYHCEELAPRAGGKRACQLTYNAQSASIVGRVIGKPCGHPPHLPDVDLTEKFADGGAVSLGWKAAWDGSYRFEGLEPGAGLTLEAGTGAPVELPPLAPGQRYVVGDLSLPGGC
jgi:hypothetical protein